AAWAPAQARQVIIDNDSHEIIEGAGAGTACAQLNPCRLRGTLTPRIVIEASGARGKDGGNRHSNGEWGTHGANGKTLRIVTDNGTIVRGIGELPLPIPPFISVGATVVHASTSGGRGGDGGKSQLYADGVGGNGGRGGSLQATLQGRYHNTSNKPGAGAIALYSRGGSAGTGHDSSYKDRALAGNGG